ncbi:hypothetical protein NQZ68_000821 [Dissostichus eleginoides]|nr:hypothetical protein NQZ68_000821 [Dissostichus eleginoides]
MKHATVQEASGVTPPQPTSWMKFQATPHWAQTTQIAKTTSGPPSYKCIGIFRMGQDSALTLWTFKKLMWHGRIIQDY